MPCHRVYSDESHKRDRGIQHVSDHRISVRVTLKYLGKKIRMSNVFTQKYEIQTLILIQSREVTYELCLWDFVVFFRIVAKF